MIIKGYRIPRVLLGTSPFIAAGQFGRRAFNYYVKFVNNPNAVRKVIEASIEVGVQGIQLLPYDWICKALKKILSDHEDIVIVGTLLPDELESSVKALSELNATVSLVHGAISDTRDLRVIEKHLNLCERISPLIGLVVHEPLKTLSWLTRVNLKVDVIMAPINKMGYLLDGSLKEVIRVYEKLGVPIIGKKVLAAGRLKPKEALEFIKDIHIIKSVAIGVASIEEAKETFKIAFEILGRD